MDEGGQQVQVTVMSPRGEEEKGQVGKRTGRRQASVFRHLGECHPAQDRKALGTETFKCYTPTGFSNGQGKDNGQLLGYKLS